MRETLLHGNLRGIISYHFHGCWWIQPTAWNTYHAEQRLDLTLTSSGNTMLVSINWEAVICEIRNRSTHPKFPACDVRWLIRQVANHVSHFGASPASWYIWLTLLKHSGAFIISALPSEQRNAWASTCFNFSDFMADIKTSVRVLCPAQWSIY